ncbi:uncharacterized protein LOC144453689 [Glandiceps talaboti]
MNMDMEFDTNECDTSLVTRRRNPFGTSMMELNEDAERGRHNERSVIDVLMLDGRENQTSTLPSLTSLSKVLNEMEVKMLTIGDCYVCHRPTETIPCKFCERNTCEMCIRQCERCCGVFCCFCSTINYRGRYDRAFCLSCNTEMNKTH